MGDLQVTVVCPHPAMDNVLQKIRKWHVADNLARSSIACVRRADTLPQALSYIEEAPGAAILVPIGFRADDVINAVQACGYGELEIVIRPPRTTQSDSEVDEQPTASLLGSPRAINVQDTLPAIRKAMLRIRWRDQVVMRELSEKQDFRQYFALRYHVWKSMSYLPESQDCIQSGWELNFTDRTAYPIGAFDREGVLIGCARLVYPMAHNSPHISLIESIITELHDAELARAFEAPKSLMHPFDILQSLQGFGDYFRQLVRQRLRCAEVSRVIVASEHRQQGLGEVLVDSLVSLAQSHRVRVLFLASHDKLQSFYERSGFSILPGLRCDRFAGVNAPAIAMARELGCHHVLH